MICAVWRDKRTLLYSPKPSETALEALLVASSGTDGLILWGSLVPTPPVNCNRPTKLAGLARWRRIMAVKKNLSGYKGARRRVPLDVHQFEILVQD